MSMNICALIPFYNHPDAIGYVVNRLSTFNLHIIIVDDGSDERSKLSLKPLSGLHNVTVVTRVIDGGKGAAVIAGMREALNRGYVYALQVDADGQHDLDKIPE